MKQAISNIKTIVAHAGCCDGITAAYLAHKCFPSAEVKFVQYNTSEHDNIQSTEGMLFVDMTPPRARVQEFVDAGAFVLDHHEGARDIVEAFGDRGIFGENSKLESGAWLVFKHLHPRKHMPVDKHSEVHDMALLAATRDVFDKQSNNWEMACEYREGVLSIFDGDLRALDCELSDIIAAGRKDIVATKRKVRDVRAKNQFHALTVGNVRVIITTRLDLVSDVADEFKDDCDLFIAHSQLVENGKPCTVFGLRSSNGTFRCDVLAKAFGGGGHPKAAGFKIHGMFFDESQWQEIVHKITHVAG